MACINRLFSLVSPTEMRMQLGHPNEVSCLTMIPFFNNAKDKLEAILSDFQIVVIKFAH